MTERLIERWLPIGALGEESVRERRSMTALPPTYYLHVWWARRPLVASRAAVLASLLPADADRERFMHMLGIHGDPVAARRAIELAKRRKERIANPYDYDRAFKYSPTQAERDWLRYEAKRCGLDNPVLLDPTAGGGSIPFEARRLGVRSQANDLNAVAALILRATVEWPADLGLDLLDAYDQMSEEWRRRLQEPLADLYPPAASQDQVDITYLWSRTIVCPYCDGLIPLSPNWKLAPGGVGVRLRPSVDERCCHFAIVRSAEDQSPGTISGGTATCPYPGCGRVVEGDEVKRQAQAGGMGEQLYAVVYKERVETKTKTGKVREKWEHGFRAPRPEDDNNEEIAGRLAEKLPEWEALGVVPTEDLPMDTESWTHGNTPAQYGASRFGDVFSPRQMLCHGTSVAVFRELAQDASDAQRAALAYLALAIDKMLDYNARFSTWDWTTMRVRHAFVRHDFALVWQYAEMAPLAAGLGFDWAVKLASKCIGELIELLRPDLDVKRHRKGTRQPDLFAGGREPPPVTITCAPGDSLAHIDAGTVDVVVMDPPYYDNVMYAELSDFFYVWLKRTAGLVYPELFRRRLTDKDNEAVANVARFKGEKGARALAGRDYQQRMRAIFAECRRVLKDDGVLTLMFTHKATGAWDALAGGLLEAGFTITASWPVNTESEESQNIKNKAAAKSTILLVCRPQARREGAEATYWEDVEPQVARAVRERVAEFQEVGLSGVDLYLSCFGPALQEFARHWPLTRGTPKVTAAKKRRQKSLLPDEEDPYAVTPEDALDAARREVKRWRMEQLLATQRQAELDPLTEWFVLAWDAFRAPRFPYDEALRLDGAVGLDLDGEVVRHIAEKKGSDLILWDSAKRAAKGALGPSDGSRTMLDGIHQAAHAIRSRTLEAGKDLVERAGLGTNPDFRQALAAVLEVLPVSSRFTKLADEEGPVGAAANDFDALEHLRQLVFAERVPVPRQLKLWQDVEA